MHVQSDDCGQLLNFGHRRVLRNIRPRRQANGSSPASFSKTRLLLKLSHTSNDLETRLGLCFLRSPIMQFTGHRLVLRMRFEGGEFFVATIARNNSRPTVEGVLPGDKLIRVGDLDTTHATWGAIYDATIRSVISLIQLPTSQIVTIVQTVIRSLDQRGFAWRELHSMDRLTVYLRQASRKSATLG